MTRSTDATGGTSSEIEYVPDPSGSGAALTEVPAERRDVACLDDEQLGALVDVGRRVEGHFGGHQDIEWAVAREGKGEALGGLFMLQARPVTVRPAEPKEAASPGSAMDRLWSTFGASGAQK